jgi:hypothetical protein
MVAVDADNRDIRRVLEKLVKLSTSCGGAFSHDTILRCKKGSLSIASRGGDEGVFIRLPLKSLPRFDHYQFSQQRDEIVLAGWSEAAAPAHFDMVDALVELYNLCGKMALHRATSAWLFLAEQPELLPLIAEGRDDPMVRATTGRLMKGYVGDLALDTFLMTRHIGIDNVSRLMPVAELVNHSARAHPFYLPPRSEGGGVAVRRKRFPDRYGDECFVCYGAFDSLDSWLIYNFVEERADFVRSVPVEVALPGIGTIGVHARFGSPVPPGLSAEPEDLQAYLPQVLSKTADRIDISFLLIPAKRSQVLRRKLLWVIDQLAPGNPQAEALAADAEKQILDKNWAYYETLRKRLQGIELKSPAKNPLLDSLNSLCALQLGRLIEYGK